MEHDVFISYSSQNSVAAQAVCHCLEQHRIRCWIAPRDLLGGTEYGDLIDEVIKNAKVVVILYSKTAASSQWVKAELNIAFEEQKVIIPFRIDQTPFTGQNRIILNHKHWIDAYPDYESKFYELVSAVSNAIGSEKSTPNYEAEAFEFGYLFSMSKFGSMCNKDDIGNEQILDVLSNFERLQSYTLEQILKMEPDMIAKELEKHYNKDIASIFEFGQFSGIISIIMVFKILGHSDGNLSTMWSTYIKMAQNLYIPMSITDNMFKLLEEGKQNELVNYHKVIRHAVEMRHKTKKECQHCGTNIADDYITCPNCLAKVK